MHIKTSNFIVFEGNFINNLRQFNETINVRSRKIFVIHNLKSVFRLLIDKIIL